MANIFKCLVYADRTIKLGVTQPLMKGEIGITDLQFVIPKRMFGFAVYQWVWWMVYVNAKGNEFTIPLVLNDDPDNPNDYSVAVADVDFGITITSGWIKFSLEAVNTDSGIVVNRWRSKIYKLHIDDTLEGNQTEFDETESDIISALIQQIQEKYNSLVGGATPEPVDLVSKMTDQKKVYLYTGSETGYTSGHWYYHNGTQFVSGGAYGAGVTDSIPTQGSTNAVSSGGVYSALAEIKPTASNIITPEEKGAKGDGITDDTQAILDAISECAEKNAVLQLNKATYLVSTVTVRYPITIQGFGDESIIKHNSEALNYGVIAIGADNVVLRDFAIDGNSGTQTDDNRRGIYIGRKNHITIERVSVHNCRNGLYIGYLDASQNYLANDVHVGGCHIYGNTMNEIVLAHAKNVIFDDCYIDAGTNDSSLIDIEAHANSAILQNIVFNNCYIKQNTGADIQCILNQYSTNDTKITFQNCNIQSGIQITTMKNVSFIGCIMNGYIEIKDCENTLISGCVFVVTDKGKNVSIYTRSYASGRIAKYITLENSVLPTTTIQDADNVTIDGCRIFRTKETSPYGTPKGSVILYGRANNVLLKACQFNGLYGVEYENQYSVTYGYTDYKNLTCKDCTFDCSEGDYYGLIDGRNNLDNATVIRKEYTGNPITCALSTAGKAIIKDWTKNLLSPILETSTKKGITCTANGDGTFTFNGTAEGQVDFNIQIFPADDALIGKTVTLTGVPSGGAYNTYFMGIQNSNSPWRELGMLYSGSQTYTLTEACRLYIRIPSGSTLNDVTFSPMMVEGSTASDFIPSTFTVTAESIADATQKNTVSVSSDRGTAEVYTYNGGTRIYPEYNTALTVDIPVDIIKYIDSMVNA